MGKNNLKKKIDSVYFMGYIKSMMIRKNIHLSDRQLLRLRELSKREGLAVAELIRRAIDDYLDMKERGRDDVER